MKGRRNSKIFYSSLTLKVLYQIKQASIYIFQNKIHTAYIYSTHRAEF